MTTERSRTIPVLALLAVAAAGALEAQTVPTCAADEHGQFDFWIGDWDVGPAGTTRIESHNEITSILGGCVIFENYDTPQGYAGQSFNAYDRRTGKWHQTWVDNTGSVLKLDGGLVDGRMVLSGPGRDQQGDDVLNEIVWTPHADGTVQQTWRLSKDGGQTWSTVFDGIYRRRQSP
jgi:hypothetical protein